MIAAQLAEVRAGIAAATAAAGRPPGDARLVAVSKTFPASAIREAFAAGQLVFGENYPQELRDKAAELGALPLEWHFIGRLQANKAKYVAAVAARVHAIDAVAQAEALAARRAAPLPILVGVNVGGEASKGGVDPGELGALLDALARVPLTPVVGLMCLPPYSEDPEASAPYFEELASLAATHRARGHALTELSMGMSHDYAVAIRHGATWVRVGTALFGARG